MEVHTVLKGGFTLHISGSITMTCSYGPQKNRETPQRLEMGRQSNDNCSTLKNGFIGWSTLFCVRPMICVAFKSNICVFQVVEQMGQVGSVLFYQCFKCQQQYHITDTAFKIHVFVLYSLATRRIKQLIDKSISACTYCLYCTITQADICSCLWCIFVVFVGS